MKTLLNLSMLILLSLFIFSCKSTPNCLTNNDETIKIFFGFINKDDNTRVEYLIKNDLNIYRRTAYGEELLGDVDADDFCKAKKDFVANIMKIQVLNVPGQQMKFVKYENLNTNYNFSALWNKDFDVKGSNEFNELFDQLNNLLPEEEKIKY